MTLTYSPCTNVILGMEFYNIDYTHTFPTTKRNVNQAILDNGMYVEKAIDLCGIMYTKKLIV